jgi:hypothetical protein
MLSAPQSWSLDRTLHFPTKPSGRDEGLAALNQKDHGRQHERRRPQAPSGTLLYQQRSSCRIRHEWIVYLSMELGVASDLR